MSHSHDTLGQTPSLHDLSEVLKLPWRPMRSGIAEFNGANLPGIRADQLPPEEDSPGLYRGLGSVATLTTSSQLTNIPGEYAPTYVVTDPDMIKEIEALPGYKIALDAFHGRIAGKETGYHPRPTTVLQR